MTPPAAKLVPFDRALDGARILWRHFLSRRAPVEGWVREFNPAGTLVRISATNAPTDAGVWHRVYDLRCEGVLEPGRAPKPRRAREEQEPAGEADSGAEE